MRHNDYLTFEEFNARSATPHSHTTPAAVGIALIAGVATLFKFLDFLGYPVWSRIRCFAHSMAMEIVRAVSPTPSLDSVASDDTVQSGGMMGNLFGMGASALSKGVRGVASALSRGSSDMPAGLGNYDNSCYQNSVIQGLASLPSLREYLEKTTLEHESFTSETTNGALLDLLSQLNDENKRGQTFWIRGKLKSMSTFTQQDAQEYYSRILDELDKEMKKATTKPDEKDGGEKEATDEKNESTTDQLKIAPIPLEGSLAQRVGCTTCGYSEGLSLIPFNCITVSLGRNQYGYDLRELLDEHTDLEYIPGVECSKCTLLKLKETLTPVVAARGHDTPFGARLQAVQEALDDEDLKDTTMTKTLKIPKKNWVKSEKSKQVVIARAPKSLVLHVNRSIFDETTFRQYKNNAGVAYPMILDLGKWCLGAQPSGTEKPDLDPKTEEWPRDPKESMLKRVGVNASEPSPFQYRLRAAVTHFGTHGNGHYVCYRPHPRAVKKAEEKAKEVVGEKDEDSASDVESTEDAAQAELQEKEQANDEEAGSTSETEEEVDEEDPTPSSDPWYRFSDEAVSAISDDQAHQGSVFMLFYERIDAEDSAPPVPTTQPVSESAPLPLSATTSPTAEADEIPVSKDDNSKDPESAEVEKTQTTPLLTSSTPIPTRDAETTNASHEPESEADAEGEAETEAETEQPTPTTQTPQLSPHTMRTAGNQSARRRGRGKSLPLVSAT